MADIKTLGLETTQEDKKKSKRNANAAPWQGKDLGGASNEREEDTPTTELDALEALGGLRRFFGGRRASAVGVLQQSAVFRGPSVGGLQQAHFSIDNSFQLVLQSVLTPQSTQVSFISF
ncbi:hypothetical protein R6Q59_011964 [Mikania micrantha]